MRNNNNANKLSLCRTFLESYKVLYRENKTYIAVQRTCRRPSDAVKATEKAIKRLLIPVAPNLLDLATITVVLSALSPKILRTNEF